VEKAGKWGLLKMFSYQTVSRSVTERERGNAKQIG